MESLITSRDPLISLMIFFGLIFIISFFSYWWAVWRVKSQKSYLEGFFAKFGEAAPKDLHNLFAMEDSSKALLLLADAYTKSGDYEKAIALYTQLQKMYDDLNDKYLILQKLGELYYKAGFLARSQEIYEEILRFTPRNHEVLAQLMLVYEKLQALDKALQIKEILEELGIEDENTPYLEAKQAIQKGDREKLIQLYNEAPYLVHMIFEYLFAVDSDFAWRHLKSDDIVAVIDILWYLPKEKISLHLPLLEEIYSAKGYVKRTKSSSIFALDILLHYQGADIEFEYLCQRCKNIFPFAFSRCPTCHSVHSPQIELVIRPKRKEYEESFSL